MFVDSHAHIDFPDFEKDLDEIVARAWEAGVRTIIIPSIEAETMAKATSIAERFPFVWFTAGWHPNDADSYDECTLLRYLGHPKCVAVGEIGLDYYHNKVNASIQKAVFEKQLEIANRLRLPAVIHIREAWDDAREILDRFPKAACDFHAYSGANDHLDWVVARRGLFGLGGPVTFKNYSERAAVAAMPLANILLETDSPFLAPHPNRGKRNEPSFIPAIAEKVAEFKGVAASEIESASTENLRRFLRIPLPISLLEAGGAKRSLSQNFLVDGNITRKIADVVSYSRCIVEIGAGNGEISGDLSEKCGRFWAIEPDLSRLTELAKKVPSAIILPKMAQEVDFTALSAFEGERITVVGNLPYADSSQIIFHLLEHRRAIDKAVFMIQKELAARLCAGPGSRIYGIPSVLLSLFFDMKREFDVPPSCFRPAPRVDSTVISLSTRHDSPAECIDYPLLSAVVKSAFAHRRKTILNSMRPLFGDRNLESALQNAGIEPSIRAERVPPEGFVALAKSMQRAD